MPFPLTLRSAAVLCLILLLGYAAPCRAEFLRGVDANYVLEMERAGHRWTGAAGQADPYQLLREAGFDSFRLRLWTGDDGINGLADATAAAKRAHAAGLKPYLVLFLSDNWSDLVKQPVPAVWKDLDQPARLRAIEAYAQRVTQHLTAAGVPVDVVEIGNEIDFGICGVFEEEWPKRVSLDYMRQQVWPRMVPIIQAAERGVRKVRPEAKFVLHLAQFTRIDYCTAFWKYMLDSGVAVDYAGLSYFPTSAAQPEQRTLAFLGQQVEAIHRAIDRPVLICESGYPSAGQFPGQFADWNKPVPGYELSPEGQRRWLADYFAAAEADPQVAGAFYWSPEWYASPMWPAFALFDETGRAKPALTALIGKPAAATQPSTVPATQPAVSAAPANERLHVYLGNLHSHTGYSDGTGTPAEAFARARDVAKLDFLAVTEHNHLLGGDKASPERRTQLYAGPGNESVVNAADAATRPGKFVAIAGQEFSSMSKGNHVNVFDVRDAIDVPNGRFDQLLDWTANHRDSTGGLPVIQFNHPALGRPGKTIDKREFGRDDFGDDAGWVQQMGRETALIELLNGEDPVGPSHDRAPQIMDRHYLLYLQKGFKVAPTGNQDNHHATWGTATAARTGIVAAELTRPALLQAMRARHVYATEDANLKVIVRVNGRLCGDVIDASSATVVQVQIDDADEPAAAYEVELLKGRVGGAPATVAESTRVQGNTPRGQVLVVEGPPLEPGTFLFVRLTQQGKVADRVWTAPVWAEQEENPQEATPQEKNPS